MKLSIIVPVYNIASFIGPCIKSIVNVNLDPKDYEVIVVNDGSTDDSLVEISKLASQYDHVKVVSQENQGLGGARNTGILNASGDYIWFVDGDDLVVSENIPSALDLAYQKGVDALAFDFLPVNEKGDPEKWIQFKLKCQNENSFTGPEFYLLNFAKSYIWLYFFKRSLFLENALFFHPSIKMEDSEIMPKIMSNCRSISFFDQPLICYRMRQGSITNIKEEKSRNHFYYSMVKVAESLRLFQLQFGESSTMYKGIALKRKQINQMLFTNLICNDFSNEANEYYVELLKSYKILPFFTINGFSTKMNFKFNFIRKIVNLSPLKGRLIYKKIFK